MSRYRPKTNQFVGASEYFAYKGLDAGYFSRMSISEVYEYLDGFLFNNETTRECQNCFLLGFLLGQEIQHYDKENK